MLLFIQLIILVLCVTYAKHVYKANLNPDKEVKLLYKPTSCFLVSKKLSTRGHLFRAYRADFLISYDVKGTEYKRWVSGNGLDASYFRSEIEQEDILSQFDVGGRYKCYYNPANPELALLVMRHDWISTFPLMLPSAIFIITLYFLSKNIRQLISAAKMNPPKRQHKKRQTKKEKKRARNETKNSN